MTIPYALLRENFEQLKVHHPDLISRFFQTLFQRHPQTTDIFLRGGQEIVTSELHDAMCACVENLDNPGWLYHHFSEIGRTHQLLGVTREMYQWFGVAFLITLRHASGSAWNEELSRGWLEVYDILCAYMHMGYKSDVTSDLQRMLHDDIDYANSTMLLSLASA